MQIEEMISKNRAECCGCEACANICPKNAITMIRDAEGFAYPKINPELCIQCGRCDATCPALNFEKKFPDELPKVFVATYPDEKILRHSSAGGVFSALSEIILREGGVVFGAGFDKKWRVVHSAARTLDDLESLRRSKYVQSQIGDVYRQVRDALKSGSVLFSGTPCQCAGLKHFLGEEPDNLLTVDLICHGAPSPAVWEYYIGTIDEDHEVAYVNFRNKRNGWLNYRFEINFKDRGYRSTSLGGDIYGKLFLHDVTLRPSCSACKFKFPNGRSDLTLGDAWGIKDYAPEMSDNRGTSLIIVHTPKGKNFFEQLNLIKKQVKFHAAIRRNPVFMRPCVADTRRENFFADFYKSDNKLGVMHKYFLEDNTEIRKENGVKNGRMYNETYRAVVAHIRKQFKKNILVITPPLDDNALKALESHFEQNFSDCGVYLLKFKDKGLLNCTETFSSVAFDLKDEVAALNNLVKQYNITEICAEEPPQFDSSVVTEWLKTCGLPVRTFSSNAE